jgi:hypothetical protein
MQPTGTESMRTSKAMARRTIANGNAKLSLKLKYSKFYQLKIDRTTYGIHILWIILTLIINCTFQKLIC